MPDATVLFNPGVIIAPVPGVFELDERLRERVRGPTLILHGTEDDLIPISSVVSYCDRAVELGSPCEVVSYEGAGHGFFNRDPFYEPTVAEMVRFLTEMGWTSRAP